MITINIDNTMYLRIEDLIDMLADAISTAERIVLTTKYGTKAEWDAEMVYEARELGMEECLIAQIVEVIENERIEVQIEQYQDQELDAYLDRCEEMSDDEMYERALDQKLREVYGPVFQKVMSQYE